MTEVERIIHILEKNAPIINVVMNSNVPEASAVLTVSPKVFDLLMKKEEQDERNRRHPSE